ncbi:MAG: uroporphyrinogen-III C-methyltransferase [Rhodobiaceae bacterium]|nr:uroporphyrinogen-III C-methyltransferase [Rhodobiaceae bacterium]MCC0011924.1 uroporphyrinogen-III C-methyltransferase [Rhodobiaceae bacterium]MCC0018574.1 uroporphyrinogen-III C-methyltransferase [Rhodobiaceae bacterium]MCC0050421.1 uroporphyrinogen-III C-methyltransferase [Rhodobiaceae bacterium]MCC0061160.1 uroporphyrinogen-III C-methyltransferase [Rhodobiaceae bacterium]
MSEHLIVLGAHDGKGTASRAGRVVLVGSGPGDPDLLTVKAARLIGAADVVLHDRLVPQGILNLASGDAVVIETGKKGFGPSFAQGRINALMVAHALAGADVVRLKSGDPGIFGRLDEEIEALDAAGIAWEVVPGVTSASASAAAIGQSLTKRGRNSSFRILTGHDIDGFAEHDWRALAKPGATAAVYMGVRAATFLRGRMLMHGTRADLPVTIVENASREDQKIVSATLADFPESLKRAGITGPAVLLFGLAPRAAIAAVSDIHTEDLREAL